MEKQVRGLILKPGIKYAFSKPLNRQNIKEKIKY